MGTSDDVINQAMVANTERSERLANLVANVVMSRAQLMQSIMDPRRNLNKECGYPETSELNVKNHYKPLYSREPVAARVVSLLPSECWKVSPQIYEDEDEEITTPFEEAWEGLSDSLRGKSWHDDEEGSTIWEYLYRADELSGIGHFGILLLGVDDGLELNQPVEGVDPFSGLPSGKSRGKVTRKLIYLRAFDESMVDIVAFESDPTSPRYGMPKKYLVTFHDVNTNSQSALGVDLTTKEVHWTRVIHLCDNLSSSEVLGTPRLRPVYNPCFDIQKVRCGSGEMYWRGAFPGYTIETHPQLGADVELDEASIRTKMYDYMNGLQRYLAVAGASMKALSPQVVSPADQIKVQIESICIQLGVPVRIFMGSERGELASSQDSDTWDDRLKKRQNRYITPRIIVPFVDRLICIGVLPEPVNGYKAKWPDLTEMSATVKADLAGKVASALQTFVQGGLEAIITPMDFLTRVLGKDQEEAQAILDATMGRIEDEDTGSSPLLSLVGGLTGFVEFFKTAQAGGFSEEQLKQALMLFYKLTPERAEAIIADGIQPPPDPMAGAGGLPPGMDPSMMDPAMLQEGEEV